MRELQTMALFFEGSPYPQGFDLVKAEVLLSFDEDALNISFKFDAEIVGGESEKKSESKSDGEGEDDQAADWGNKEVWENYGTPGMEHDFGELKVDRPEKPFDLSQLPLELPINEESEIVRPPSLFSLINALR